MPRQKLCSLSKAASIQIQDFHKFELKNLSADGYMLNYMYEDSIMGLRIEGIWSNDEKLKKIFKTITS